MGKQAATDKADARGEPAASALSRPPIDWGVVEAEIASGCSAPAHRFIAPYLMTERLAKKFVAASAWRHYVYGLCSSSGDVFYVGKGVGGRMFAHQSDAECGASGDKAELIRRLGDELRYVVFAFHQTDTTARCHEAALIETAWPMLLNSRRDTFDGAIAAAVRDEIKDAARLIANEALVLLALALEGSRLSGDLAEIARAVTKANATASAEAAMRVLQ